MPNEATNDICNNIVNDIEINILFWTLIIAILSLSVSIIVSIISHSQSAKLNTITLLKDRVGKAFEENLIDGFREAIMNCKYKFVKTNETIDKIHVSFDEVPLINLENRLTKFMGEIAFLNYVIPQKYNSLNAIEESIVMFIDNEILPYALFVNAPSQSNFNENKILVQQKAEKKYKKLQKLIKRLYKKAFKIYKYGV